MPIVGQSAGLCATPIIDRGVKSGNDTEYRATVTLLGGTRLSAHARIHQRQAGVGDPNLNKDVNKLGKSSIHLLWVPPRRALEVIPARCLTTNKKPRSVRSENAVSSR